jgi:hypothetical protein
MDPYENLLADNPFERAEKLPVTGSIIVLMDIDYDDRGLELVKPLSRAIPAGEIHELFVTNESEPRKSGVDDCAVVGFLKVDRGGVVAVGDEVSFAGDPVGTVVGFDASHAPNHYNVVVQSNNPKPGVEMDIALGVSITFE